MKAHRGLIPSCTGALDRRPRHAAACWQRVGDGRYPRMQVLWIPVPDIPLNTFALDSALQRTLIRCGVEAAQRFLSLRVI